jgi:hypothetical protein
MSVRRVTAVAAAGLLALAGCSAEEPRAKTSANVAGWKAGDAVVVLVADVRRGPNGDLADYGRLMERPGVIAVWSKGSTLRLSMSRQAMLVDMAALKLELERTPGLSNVRESVVPPRW